ncbi:MAG: hypothetical protein ACJLS2_11335 [Microcella pacifica]
MRTCSRAGSAAPPAEPRKLSQAHDLCGRHERDAAEPDDDHTEGEPAEGRVESVPDRQRQHREHRSESTDDDEAPGLIDAAHGGERQECEA